MRKEDIVVGERYFIAASEKDLDKDPRDAYVLEALGPAVQVGKDWCVPVRDVLGDTLLHRRWAVRHGDHQAVKLRYVIEQHSADRITIFEARVAEREKWRREAEALLKRAADTGLVNERIVVTRDEYQHQRVTVTVPRDKLDEFVRRLESP